MLLFFILIPKPSDLAGVPHTLKWTEKFFETQGTQISYFSKVQNVRQRPRPLSVMYPTRNTLSSVLGVSKKASGNVFYPISLDREGFIFSSGMALKRSCTQANVQRSSLFSGLSLLLPFGSLYWGNTENCPPCKHRS